jgi:hypothetical protein
MLLWLWDYAVDEENSTRAVSIGRFVFKYLAYLKEAVEDPKYSKMDPAYQQYKAELWLWKHFSGHSK